jgi:sugar lactone lactonase YvrE
MSRVLPAAVLALAACQIGEQTTAKRSTIPYDATKLARAAGARGPLSDALEPVAFFTGAMPTGITVSREQRIFLSFPRWNDPVALTAAELTCGWLRPIPDLRMNQLDEEEAPFRLVSVQSAVVDPINRLWLVDTGNINWRENLQDTPKLVVVDLRENRVAQIIHLWPDVALPTSYLNDIRFDLTRGEEGTAYITDSAARGPNAIIVVDIATGHAFRRLHDHPSTKADPGFVARVEGAPLLRRSPRGIPTAPKVGADGIAISADGKTLYYRPLMSHRLYSVSTDALANESVSEDAVGYTVIDHGDIGYASDGLESDRQGRLYLTDYEHHAIHRRLADGTDEILVSDPRLIWPDTLALATDGYLYVTVNQLDRQPEYHDGCDLREGPYALFRIKVDATPVTLRP